MLKRGAFQICWSMHRTESITSVWRIYASVAVSLPIEQEFICKSLLRVLFGFRTSWRVDFQQISWTLRNQKSVSRRTHHPHARLRPNLPAKQQETRTDQEIQIGAKSCPPPLACWVNFQFATAAWRKLCCYKVIINLKISLHFLISSCSKAILLLV